MEIVLLIGTIAAVFITLQIFMKRAFYGRMRSSLDQLSTQQFDPGEKYNYTARSTGARSDVVTSSGVSTSSPVVLPGTRGETSTTSVRLGDTTEVTVPNTGPLQ